MADTPNEAPAEVTKAPESVETPNTNQEPTQAKAPEAPDMHGFTSDQLAEMKKFFDNNGGFDKIKSRISNPEPKPAEPTTPLEPRTITPPETQQQQAQETQPYTPPAGSISEREYFIKRYFMDLAGEEKYAGIAKDIVSGDVLTEMRGLGMQPILPNGSIDAEVVNKFLTLKAQTVPAKQTGTTPEASAAPTVDYVPVGEKITNMDEARAIIAQDSQLRRSGQAGHPRVKDAEDFLRGLLSPDKK